MASEGTKHSNSNDTSFFMLKALFLGQHLAYCNQQLRPRECCWKQNKQERIRCINNITSRQNTGRGVLMTSFHSSFSFERWGALPPPPHPCVGYLSFVPFSSFQLGPVLTLQRGVTMDLCLLEFVLRACLSGFRFLFCIPAFAPPKHRSPHRWHFEKNAVAASLLG